MSFMVDAIGQSGVERVRTRPGKRLGVHGSGSTQVTQDEWLRLFCENLPEYQVYTRKTSRALSYGRRQNESKTGYNLQDQKDMVLKTAKPWRWWLSSFTSHPRTLASDHHPSTPTLKLSLERCVDEKSDINVRYALPVFENCQGKPQPCLQYSPG